jgi:hypothetical protein
MLVTVQLPITDVRHFLPRDVTGQLPLVTAFTTLTPGKDFIRAFGPLRRRYRGGVSAWPGEELYANAGRALRFDPADLERVAFRRLMSDGTATTRMEVGISLHGVPWVNSAPQPIDRLTADILDRAIKVRDEPSGFTATTLGGAGPQLAKHFRRSTTALGSNVEDPPAWWCRAAPAAVLIEGYEVEPPHRAVSPVTGLEDHHIRLYHWYQDHGGNDVDVWLLTHSGADKGTLRRTRIHLLRLHAEWQALRAVLRLLADERIAVEPRTDHTDRLQHYLNQKTNLIERRRLDGMPQSELLTAAYRTDELTHEGERASLRAAVAAMRPSLRRKLEALASERRIPRILFLAANPTDMSALDLGNEQSKVHDALWGTLGREFELKPFWSVEATELQRRIDELQPHIVHFSGHGDAAGEIVLEGPDRRPRPVPADALGDLFRLLGKQVRCVVLNACGSLPTAQAIAPHVDVVLGTSRRITDDDAITFTETFYRALGIGGSVRHAYERAVNQLGLQDRPNVTEILVRPGVDADTMTLQTMSAA